MAFAFCATSINKMTDIIEEIQQIQRETEEMYLDSKDSEFVLLKSGQDSDRSGKQE